MPRWERWLLKLLTTFALLLPTHRKKAGLHSIRRGGSGLGLAHARQTIEACDGEIRIESELRRGTKVSFTLSREAPPCWFLESLKISNERIVIIDDDESIHQTWLEKFRVAGLSSSCEKIERFYSLEDATRFVNSLNGGRGGYLFLVDYEFIGSFENGLAWILRHQLQEQSILVTNLIVQCSIQIVPHRVI